MGFADAIRTCLSKYVTFSGRARRSEYWWFVLFVVLGNLVFGIVDSAIFGTTEMTVTEGDTTVTESVSVSVFGAIFSLAMFLPQLAAGARRLHDRDMSAWWLLLLLLPLLGALILLVIFVLPGTPGSNRFGPDPKT